MAYLLVARAGRMTLRERKIVYVPSLVGTLRSLKPGDYVHCGHHWAYGTIKQTACTLNISIATKRTDKGITIVRQVEIPEPS